MKDFFKMTFATMCGIVLLSVITGILFMISLVGMIASESASTKVKDNSVFVLKMNGVINEQGMGETTGCKASVGPQSALIIHN